MRDRIEPRPYRLGTADNADPENITELEARREKHERLTRGRPKKTFAALLDEKMKDGRHEEQDDEPSDEEREAASAQSQGSLLGLDPNQSPGLAEKGSKRRSARVIIRG